MLKVYGVTYDHPTNYGTGFQAFALQTAVEKIKVGTEKEPCQYSLIPVKILKEFPHPKSSLKYVANRMIRHFHRKQFLPFEKKHMKFVPITSFTQLDSLNDEADAFVCGSDVIWRPDYSWNLGVFYLDFAKKYKFSYAASFGTTDISEDAYPEIRSRLSSFNCISVREKSALEILKHCTEKLVRVIADPVLLLDRNEWDSYALPAASKKKYFFVYVTHLNSTIENFVRKVEAETGLKPVYSAWGSSKALRLGRFQVQKPECWLQLIRDAEYVVTNSFHATLFSIIFHKRFFTVVKGEKSQGNNVRMYDFLKRVGLESRMYSAVPESIDQSEVDYTQADTVVAEMREEAFAFLQENLDAAYEEKKKR
ncbi:MAG: polysaccharide pyruvyl transferase family protein [Lachnospiraceae bacterium]|nr:polysaccharide pyruvyl transferase family protein [Lachnospiraceae bacterium]